MPVTGNSINNNALIALTKQAGAQVTQAIEKASARTGVDFSYLMEKAAAESSFRTDAKAGTSSASGLYQFIESTWLRMVRNYGERHGMADMAEQISPDGKVADEATKQTILNLRNDPEKAALLAAEYAAENKRHLVQNTDLKPEDIGSTELYFAHFLGAGGASSFFNAMKDNDLANAADLFPRAAQANRNVFYDRDTGQARTLAGVYAFFNGKFNASSGKDGLAVQARASATTKSFPPRPAGGSTASALHGIEDNAIRHFIQDMLYSGSVRGFGGGQGRADSNAGSTGFFSAAAFTMPFDLMILAQTAR